MRRQAIPEKQENRRQKPTKSSRGKKEKGESLPERVFHKLFSSGESVLVRKDIRMLWGEGSIRILLTLAPVLLLLGLPGFYYVFVRLLPESDFSALPEGLVELLSFTGEGSAAFWMHAFVTLVCPLLYLCVPLITAVGCAASVFLKEKENGSLESLFLSAMSAKSIYNAKVTTCVLISAVISLLSFVIFSIFISILGLLVGAPFFISLEWMVILLLLTPALILFAVVFVSLNLKSLKTVGEGLQTVGYLIFPLLLLYLLQMAGLYRIRWFFLMGLSAGLIIASVVLFNRASRGFTPEKMAGRA